jgi:LPXTG-motif cell wall-anchored protein
MTILSLLVRAFPAEAERVSLGQIQDRLRSLQGNAESAVKGAASPNVLAVAGGGGVALIALAFLFGRRRGRKRATVLEIRRI